MISVGPHAGQCSALNKAASSDEVGIAPRTVGCGVIGGHAHLLPAYHLVVYDVEKTTCKCCVNWLTFIGVPLSSVGRYGYDTVMMHKCMQG